MYQEVGKISLLRFSVDVYSLSLSTRCCAIDIALADKRGEQTENKSFRLNRIGSCGFKNVLFFLF